MKLVFVKNLDDTEWHRTEVRGTSPLPLRGALCGERAQADSWTHMWARIIDPPGMFCVKCDELAKRLYQDLRALDNEAAAKYPGSVDELIRSVFGKDGPDL